MRLSRHLTGLPSQYAFFRKLNGRLHIERREKQEFFSNLIVDNANKNLLICMWLCSSLCLVEDYMKKQ